MVKIAVFASGEGTNLQALLDATKSRRIHGEVILVASNNADAGALHRAERAGVERLVLRPKDFATAEEYSAESVEELLERTGIRFGEVAPGAYLSCRRLPKKRKRAKLVYVPEEAGS